jgi:hypothetical protein
MAAAVRRPGPARHPGAADGEPISARLVAQPFSAGASLAYLAAGAVIWSSRADDADPVGATWLALAVASNGIGGLAFHGPGDRVSRWVHDAALCSTLAAFAVRRPGVATPTSSLASVATLASVAVAVDPKVTNAVAGLLGGGFAARAVGAWGRGLAPDPRPVTIAALAAAAGLALHRTSRPSSRVHVRTLRRWGHAGWHVLSAASLAALGIARWRPRQKPSGGPPSTGR